MIRLVLIFILGIVGLANAEPIPVEFLKPSPYDITYGNESAAIQVLEYYSLTCPHCSHFYEHSFPSLKKDYIDTGKVKWIKRSFVTDLPALKATMFLACVSKDRYESYLKILLSKQSNWAYQQDFLTILGNIASLGGMSPQEFKKCVDNKANEKAITDDNLKTTAALKMHGTPSFFINRELVTIYSEDSFQEHFDKLLTKK